MLLRFIQLTASVFLIFVAALHFAQSDQQAMLEAGQVIFEDHWQTIYFAIVAVVVAWLFRVAPVMRPLVVVVAAIGFFVIAMMEDPSAESFRTALDGLTDRMMTGIETFQNS